MLLFIFSLCNPETQKWSSTHFTHMDACHFMLCICYQREQWICFLHKQTQIGFLYYLLRVHSAFSLPLSPFSPSLQTVTVVPASSSFGSPCLKINHIHGTPELTMGAGWDHVLGKHTHTHPGMHINTHTHTHTHKHIYTQRLWSIKPHVLMGHTF